MATSLQAFSNQAQQQQIAGIFKTNPRVHRRSITDANSDEPLIIPDVTIREEHNDSMTITEHPVQKGTGAFVSDHAYRMPAELTLEYGFSPSGPGNQSISVSYINDIYQKILEYQSDRILLNVYTGKRAYKRMLIENVTLTSDLYTDNALLVCINLREIMQASTQLEEDILLDPTTVAFPDRAISPLQLGTQQVQSAPLFDPDSWLDIAGGGS
jgi:hypothetical protein